MSIRYTHIICHYSEIGLKGRNRSWFENKLRNNIRQAVRKHQPGLITSVTKREARFLLELTPKGAEDPFVLEPVLKKQFGVAYFAFAVMIDAEMDQIKETALGILSASQFESFRITARKTNSSFPFSKQVVNEEVGAEVVGKMNKSVNLGNPEATCHIDIIGEDALIYVNKYQGPGGLPVSVSGKVAVMLSGGIDSPVAAWLMMKRGASPVYVHFHSIPYVSEASVEKVRELARLLQSGQPVAKLYLVKFASIQDEIVLQCDPRYRVLLYRRFMIRITERIAKLEKAGAIVTGESLGQVASQTMENMMSVQQAVNSLIIRPLVGMNKLEIIDLARTAGTYETSIQPHQDCCTLFIPENPATRAHAEVLVNAEKQLDIEKLVEEAVKTADSEMI